MKICLLQFKLHLGFLKNIKKNSKSPKNVKKRVIFVTYTFTYTFDFSISKSKKKRFYFSRTFHMNHRLPHFNISSFLGECPKESRQIKCLQNFEFKNNIEEKMTLKNDIC